MSAPKNERPPAGWKVGYKVIERIKNGALASLIANREHESIRDARGSQPYVTAYRVGKTTRRRKGCGPLAVFTALRRASPYERAGLEVYKCFYKPSKDTKIWCVALAMERTLFSLPQGTALADEVTLVRRIRS